MENLKRSPRLNKNSPLWHPLERALETILARVSVFDGENASRIGVAYSGGLDSTVLLHVAQTVASRKSITVHALHVHHGLSSHADEWLAMCRETARAIGVQFDFRRIDVPSDTGAGMEKTARIARYRALGEMARENGLALLMTAHHQNDQAETVLLQLLRGAGLAGLAAMKDVQINHSLLGPGIPLARPFLGIARAQLQAVATACDLAYVEDESNADSRYRRNALRNDVVPTIERFFPGHAAVVARSARHAQSAAQLHDDLAEIDFAACRSAQANAELELDALKKLSSARLSNLMRYWLARNNVPILTTAQLDELCAQMLEAADDTQPAFCIAGFSIRRYRQQLRVERHENPVARTIATIRWNGEPFIDVPSWGGRLHFIDADIGILANTLRDIDLSIAPRSGGERLQQALNRPSKGLKTLYQEQGIPAWERNQLPLVFAHEKLVFAAGIGIDMRHALPGKCIVLTWERLPGVLSLSV